MSGRVVFGKCCLSGSHEVNNKTFCFIIKRIYFIIIGRLTDIINIKKSNLYLQTSHNIIKK